MTQLTEMTGAPVYDLAGVSRSYGSGDTAVHAIGGIDLQVERGEFVAIAGPSGSGKTTLLQLLGALDRPTAGWVRFEGADLAQMSDSELARIRLDALGFIFQQFNLIPTLTAQQNVEVALAPVGLNAALRRERARELLALVGLGGRTGHLPSQLSGGEQQRVAIARALSNEPELLLADEPTGNLDTHTGEEIMDLLRRLWSEQGLTLILITHDPAIAATAPRLIRMRDGRLHEEHGAGGADDAGGPPPAAEGAVR